MMTEKARITSLHARMAARRRRRERRIIMSLSFACAGLTACLAVLAFGGNTAHYGGIAGLYTGATMLFDGTGGYVLAAVLAFMVGVIVTVLCIRRQKPDSRNKRNDKQDRGDDL